MYHLPIPMHILFYVPDNQITRHFIPHLWPWVLQTRTPAEHRITILDANVRRYSTAEVVEFIRRENVELVGIGFMSRLTRQAYQMASAIRKQTSVPVVMGGPHVTEVPDEPLGRTGHPRVADAVVQGEADDIWPIVIEDAVQNKLKELYHPAIVNGKDLKPSLRDYPIVPWQQLDLRPFNLMHVVPEVVKKFIKAMGLEFDAVYVLPVETGRGCPYGCEFCTVTGFFGDQIRFRDNENVIAELLALKAMAKRDNAFVIICFVDDNLAINPKRLKSLLHDIIKHDAVMPWFGQISMNLLRDEELIALMSASGAQCILLGLESINSESLNTANKSFNKPLEYAPILNSLAKNNILPFTSFIFGMDGDHRGIARETVRAIETWPPCFPIFTPFTPYPATPLYARLQKEGRLTHPEHWLESQDFKAAFTPKFITAAELEGELAEAWRSCYAPDAFRRTQKWMVNHDRPFKYQVGHFVTRFLFRGIYFPQTTRWTVLQTLARNSPTILSLIKSGIAARQKTASASR